MNARQFCVPRLVLVVSLAAAISLLVVTNAQATRFWKNSVATGNWSTVNNWSASSAAGADNAGPPGSEDVNIVNADGVAHTVTLDVNSTALVRATVNQTGGSAVNTLSILNNVNLTSQALFVGGWTGGTFGSATGGRGAVNQANGTVTMADGTDLALGLGTGSTGTYTLSSGALVAPQSEFIGSVGTGTLNQLGGTNTIGVGSVGYLNLGTSFGGFGTYNLSLTGQLVSNKLEIVGDAGSAIFNQTGGSNKVQGTGNDLILGNAATGNGTYNISGGTLDIADDAIVGGSGVGSIVIQTGGSVNVGDALSIKSNSEVDVSGGFLRWSSLTGTGGINRLFFSSGTLQFPGNRTLGTDPTLHTLYNTSSASAIFQTKSFIAEGGVITVDVPTYVSNGQLLGGTNMNITTSTSTPHYLTVQEGGIAACADCFIDSNNGAIVTGDNSVFRGLYLQVGGTTSGSLEVKDHGTVDFDHLVLDDTATVTLNGGTIKTRDLSRDPGSLFKFISGTLELETTAEFGNDALLSDLFGALPVIPTGKELALTGGCCSEFHVTTVIDGGTLTLYGMRNAAAYLKLKSGTLNVTNDNLVVGPVTTISGTLGEVLDLGPTMTVNSNLGITNNGLVTGDGQIGGTLTNAAAGELRGEPGKSLKLTGANNTNAGQINLFGGLVEFTQNLTNNAGGFISGNGTIKTNALTNNGTMNFSGLANVIGDVTNVAGGKIISSGGGPTTFFDDVVNNGEIRTSAGSFTTFYGSTSGSGTYTGLGTVNFEGDLKPGNSPAAVSFGGDVVLGVGSTLQMEIGGINAGSQFDQLNVVGKLTLGGTLKVVFVNGFVPSFGQSFDLLNWGTVAGSFSSVVLPALSSGSWDTTQLGAGILSVISGIPGDYDNNGVVDASDYTTWKDHLGQATSLPNDATAGVTGGDYDVWRNHFGQSAGSGAGGVANHSVPEPASVLLLVVGLVVVGCKRGA